MSETIILVIAVEALMIAVGALIVLIVMIFMNRKKERTPEPAPFRGSQTSLVRSWHLDLYDMSSGYYIAKDFCGQVLLGRGSQEAEPFWRMSLGMYPTISREQCIVYDRGGFLMIENISSVNLTMINGYVLKRPYMLTKGCQLGCGGIDFYVAELYRVN